MKGGAGLCHKLVLTDGRFIERGKMGVVEILEGNYEGNKSYQVSTKFPIPEQRMNVNNSYVISADYIKEVVYDYNNLDTYIPVEWTVNHEMCQEILKCNGFSFQESDSSKTERWLNKNIGMGTVIIQIKPDCIYIDDNGMADHTIEVDPERLVGCLVRNMMIKEYKEPQYYGHPGIEYLLPVNLTRGNDGKI